MKRARTFSAGAIAVLVVLLALLALAVHMLAAGWDVGPGGASITASGYLAMGLGIFFTLLLGIGLMSLMFYSHRRDRD